MISVLELKLRNVLVVVAHPDDEIIGFGAGINSLYEKGAEVKVVTASYGGTAAQSQLLIENMITRRKAEMRDADKILGIKDRIFLEFKSQELYPPRKELHHALIKVIRDEKPDLIVTHYSDFHHFDHEALYKNVAWSVTQAAEEIMEEDLGKRYITPILAYFPVGAPLEEINFPLEITSKNLEAQVEALSTQRSQSRSDNYLRNWTEVIISRANVLKAPLGYPLIQQLQTSNIHPPLISLSKG